MTLILCNVCLSAQGAVDPTPTRSRRQSFAAPLARHVVPRRTPQPLLWAAWGDSRAAMLAPKPSALRNGLPSLNERPKPAGRGISRSNTRLFRGVAAPYGAAFSYPLHMLDRSSILLPMNRLSIARRAQVIRMLVEGSSIRSVG